MLQPDQFIDAYRSGTHGFTTFWQPDWEIQPLALKALIDSKAPMQLVDVRQVYEHDYTHLAGSLLIPLDQLPYRMRELDPSKPVVVYCHHGHRSAEATRFLRYAGFAEVRSLAGGTEAWADQVDPTMLRY